MREIEMHKGEIPLHMNQYTPRLVSADLIKTIWTKRIKIDI